MTVSAIKWVDRITRRNFGARVLATALAIGMGLALGTKPVFASTCCTGPYGTGYCGSSYCWGSACNPDSPSGVTCTYTYTCSGNACWTDHCDSNYQCCDCYCYIPGVVSWYCYCVG